MEPKHLRKWTRPKYYTGATWDDYYVFLSRHRDSDLIEQSNFAVALKALGEESRIDREGYRYDRVTGETENVIVARASHFLVGWCELLLIHESDSTSLALADAMAERIENYPILDEDDHSAREWDRACETWEHFTLRDRIHALSRYVDAGAILNARFSDLSKVLDRVDDNGSLTQYLAGD